MKLRNNIYLTIFISGVSLHVPALAGTIEVVNENKTALTVKIKAEGNPMEENLATYIQKIPAEYKSTFIVNSSDIKGKSYFSIKGDTYPLAGDKCEHLSVNKNYKVTFLNDPVGTTCLAEEMK